MTYWVKKPTVYIRNECILMYLQTQYFFVEKPTKYSKKKRKKNLKTT